MQKYKRARQHAGLGGPGNCSRSHTEFVRGGVTNTKVSLGLKHR